MSLPLMATLGFIFSIVTLGYFFNLILLALSNLQERFSQSITPSLRNIPLYFVLGATAYTFFGSLLSIGGIKLSIFKFLLLVVIMFLLNLLLYGSSFWQSFSLKKSLWPIAQIKKNNLIFAAFAVIIVFIVSKMIFRIAIPSFDIDLLGHLLSKAKILLFTTYRDSLLFHDPLFSNLHIRYPPMFGIFYNLLFLFMGGAANSYYHVVNYFILFCIGYTVYGFLSEGIPRWQAVIWFFVCISAKHYLYQSYLIDNADIFLSLFFLLAACALIHLFRTNKTCHLLTSAVVVSGGALLKNEGILFALFVAVFAVAFYWLKAHKLKEGLKALTLFLLVLAILVGPWLVYRFTLPNPEETHERLLALSNINDSWPYLAKSVSVFLKQLFSFGWQGIFILWFFFFGFILFVKPHIRSKTIIVFFSSIIFAQLVCYLCIFWLCYGRIIQQHIPGIRRLVAHCYPLAIVVVGLAAGRCFFEAKEKNEMAMQDM